VRRQANSATPRGRGGRRTPALGLLLLLGLAAGGCTFCQDVRDGYKYRYTKPDNPLKVLQGDNDNDRVWALRYMQEPATHGGDKSRQEDYVKILTAIATTDRDSLCRMQAVRTLADYKDPRAVKALEDAYWNARVFPPDVATVLREQVLVSLGQTANPEARELLIQVARAGASEDTQQEKLQTLDLRLCALKGLGHFKQSDVTEALHHVMATEKDVSLRDRAYLSLEEATGAHLPPDPAKWDRLLHGSQQERDAVVRESNGFFSLVGWWH
jgi:hypothetical protein